MRQLRKTSEVRMDLNLPVADHLSRCRNLLIAGMGGGFDLFCGLPIYFELRRRGQNVYLANLSFTELRNISGGSRLTPTLVEVSADTHGPAAYFPEGALSRWFREQRQEDRAIWCFEKTGVRPLLAGYRALVRRLEIDGILLIDGGVDSLLHGDENGLGTLLEDALSLAAVHQLKDVPLRMIACLGFGAERDMRYAEVLENIAELARAGAFLGACALVQAMPAYQAYEAAVLAVQAQYEPSVINSSIISAVRGHFGNYHLTEKTRGSELWISPLMPLYWFFDLQSVAARNMLLADLADTETFLDAVRASYTALEAIIKRMPRRSPLL